MTLPVALAIEPEFVDGTPQADCRHRVLENPPTRHMHVNPAGRTQGQIILLAQTLQAPQLDTVIAT